MSSSSGAGTSSSRRPLSSFLLESVIPVTGVISYHAFALHVCNPRLLPRFLSLESAQRLITGFSVSANLGSAVYLYHRRHIRCLPDVWRRVLLPAYGSLSFHFASCFLWILTRAYVHKDWHKAVLALASASSLLLIAREYVMYIDSLITDPLDPPADAADP